MSVYNIISNNKADGKRMFAVLADPDKYSKIKAAEIATLCLKANVDLILVGGSLLTTNNLESCIAAFRENCNIPILLFPGGVMQINPSADGIMLLSLISGRNPDMLIGKHVESACLIRQSGLEVIPTGYMLIDGGSFTSVQYISNTMPIPSGKEDIAISTAIAGEMLGLKMIYLEAGSGAVRPVAPSVISAVSKAVKIPVMAGGGICTAESAVNACKAGADIIVAGNIFEKKPDLIGRLADAVHKLK